MATRKPVRKAGSRKRKGTGKGRRARKGSRLWPLLAHLCFWSILAVGAWCAWIDYRIRDEFADLRWALPGRIYARPMELYAGAHIGFNDLRDNLLRLGYRQTPQVNGPGEFQADGGRIQLRTRGFDFWDGTEPSRYVNVTFSGRHVAALRGTEAQGALPLVRLEPVEIAQIDPETGEDRLPLALADVPDKLIEAIIAVEDQRFYSHFGVDPIGIARAMWSNLRAGGIVQGGSTLTQQLVKNLYLNRERTLRRKAEEAVMALALELHFSKEEILTAYLNEIFLGQDGNRAIHGFALAAQHYFGRPLAELRLEELALLAGLPRGASYYNPLRHPERATTRRNVVLAAMRNEGYISEADYARASAAQLALRANTINREGYPAFMEQVYADLARDYDQGDLATAGLRIFTTLDVGVQSAMEAGIAKAVAEVARKDSPLEAAVVITDAATGEIRALAGSRKSGYTGFNRALKARRPIGSLVKPAVYLAALERPGYHLASVLSDTPLSLTLPNGQSWRPSNYDDKLYGEVYLHDALERSMNLATVDLGMRLGVDKTIDVLRRLGYRKDIQPLPSLLLGAIEMTPIEVAQIYQTLAANGFRSPLRTVEAVTTARGEPLHRYGFATEQVADPADVYLLEFAMQGVFDRGTARSVKGRLSANLPLAGKTGTTNDARDSWFAGYGDDLQGVVWLGYDDNRETSLTGATGALRVWTEIMASLDIQPRSTAAPAGVEWQRLPEIAVRDPSRRDCTLSRALPFRRDRLPEVAYSCEVDDSFFERVINRIQSRSQ